MRKIIKGRLYDTDTAQEVAQAEHGYPGDVERIVETLYRKRTGEFFLHGKGGPATWAARQVGKFDRTAGEEIAPLTYDEAIKWAEENLEPDVYEKIFGEVSEDGETCLHSPISAAAKAKLEREAARRGITQRSILEALIYTLDMPKEPTVNAYAVDGTICGKPAELTATVYRRNRDGSKDISCQIMSDDYATNVDAIDIYAEIEDVDDPEEIVEWAESKGFAWDDQANVLPARREALLTIIAGELGLDY